MTSIFDKLIMVKPGSEEWHKMWKRLATHRINRHVDDPDIADNYGETWQYMCTYDVRSRWLGRMKVVHSFRHRMHPRPGFRLKDIFDPTPGSLYLEIPASSSYNAEYFKLVEEKAA